METAYIIITLAVLSLISCSSESALDGDKPAITPEAFGENEWPQKWQLMEMSGNIANIPPQRGRDMEWQEHYVLFQDGTFTKIRQWEDQPTQSKGTFRVSSNEHGKFIEFKHDLVNSLVGACVQGPHETLAITSENKLVGTWSMCDGPGLVYERVNYDVSVDGL